MVTETLAREREETLLPERNTQKTRTSIGVKGRKQRGHDECNGLLIALVHARIYERTKSKVVRFLENRSCHLGEVLRSRSRQYWCVSK
jgi:hypothetical protein